MPVAVVSPSVDAGYAGAVTTNYVKKRRDPYAIHRVKVSDSSSNLFLFWTKVSGYARAGKKIVSYPGA